MTLRTANLLSEAAFRRLLGPEGLDVAMSEAEAEQLAGPPPIQAHADRVRYPVCGALRGMESWQPTCSLRVGHEGPHRWGTP